MLPEVLFGSTNSGKLLEVRQVLAQKWNVISLGELEERGKLVAPEVEEDLPTYEGNADKKAETYFAWSGLPSLADDTGLEVTALGGAPGVFSARYAGEPANPQKNREKLLRELSAHNDRSARFICCISYTDSTGTFRYLGELAGAIIFEPKGSGGFGYDSLFIPTGYQETLAELKERGVPVVTHRMAALRKFLAAH